MAELLADARRELLAIDVVLDEADFDRAWDESWDRMRSERAWPHATEHRRQWRVAMVATRSEMRAAFLGRPTMFGDLANSLMSAAARQGVVLEPEQLPKVILGAIAFGYSVVGDHEEVAA